MDVNKFDRCWDLLTSLFFADYCKFPIRDNLSVNRG